MGWENRLSGKSSRPDELGGYSLCALLGTGGMGRVYLAFDSDDHPVAIKVIRAELSEQTPFRLRFAREVQAMRAVNGPCTANLIAADLDSTPQWVAMEYVPGPTLQRALDSDGPLSPDTVRLLAWALAEGLADIHRAGIIHRDLKPGNIVLGPDGPRLLDFGIARSIDATSLTHMGERPGSLAWMAPEVLRGSPQGAYTDVHAWGAVIYAAATGEPPFGAGPPAAVAWRIQHVDPAPDQLRRVVPGLSEVVLRALRPEPSGRPSVTELITATRLTADPDSTTVRGSSDILTALADYWVPPMADNETPLQSFPAGDPGIDADSPEGTQRKRLRVVAALGTATIAVSAAAGLLWNRSSSLAEPPMPSRNSGVEVAPSPQGSSTPSGLGVPSDLADEEVVQCDTWVWAIGPVGCAFATNVAGRYRDVSLMPAYANSTEGPPILGQVPDPATGASYDMYCQRVPGTAYCRGGDQAAVSMIWPLPGDASIPATQSPTAP